MDVLTPAPGSGKGGGPIYIPEQDYEGVELIEIRFPDGEIRHFHPEQVKNFSPGELNYLGIDRNGNPVSNIDFKGIAMAVGGLIIFAIILDNVIEYTFDREPVLLLPKSLPVIQK
jgi:hypothetical protein